MRDNLGQITKLGVLYKQSVLEVLTQHVVLLRGDSIALRSHSGNFGIFNRNYPMKGLHFGYIYDTVKRDVMRSKSKEMAWKEGVLWMDHHLFDTHRFLAIRQPTV